MVCTLRPRTRASLLLAGSLVAAALVAGTPTPVAVAAPPTRPALPALESSTTRYIVRFSESASESDISDLINTAKNRGRSVRKGQGKAVRQAQLSKVFKGGVYDLSSDVVTELVARIAARDNRLAWIERDANVAIDPPATLSSLATQAAAPWGLDRIDQANLPLNLSYSYGTTGAGVTVYVVDTGILATHNDFGGRVRAGYDAIGDGRNTADCNGHGTHVAGTVGGTTYGVAKAASLVAVRVLDCSGAGTLSGVIAGIDWALEDHTSGPAVINLSLGGGASSSLDAAVDRAIADGITVVVAAGNSNIDACTVSPARASNAITVGATTSSDTRASYSNFGSCLDIFAPGSSISSATYTSNSATATLSGTSMASPHVAGAAARLLGASPTLRPDQVASALIAAATPNKVSGAGTGSPNRLLFVSPDDSATSPTTSPTTAPSSGGTTSPTTSPTTTAPPTPPAAPVNVRAVAGNQSAVVSWTDGSSDDGLTHDHTIYVYRSGRLEKSVTVGDVPQATVSDLRQNQSYTFRVQARNVIGPSDLSAASNVVVPFSASVKRADTVTEPDTPAPSDGSGSTIDLPPSAPRRLAASLTGSTVVLRWAARRVADTQTEFTVVIRYKGRVISRIPMGSATELTLRGIRSTTLYSYRVVAENGSGEVVRSKIIRANR